MFLTTFATLGALLSLYNSSLNSTFSFKYIKTMYSSDVSRSENVTTFGAFSDGVLKNTQLYRFYDEAESDTANLWCVTPDLSDVNNPKYYFNRYYISSEVSNGGNNLIGYIDWWFTDDNTIDQYRFLNVRTHFDNTYNIQFLLNITVYSTNGHVPVVQYCDVIDLTSPNFLDFSYVSTTKTSLFTSYTLSTNDNYMDVNICGVPMDEIAYNHSLFGNYQDGYNDGYRQGESDGYYDGFNDGYNVDTTVFTVFSGIMEIAFIPVNFFLAIWNFDILGINITGMVTALLTVALVIIIIRFVTGKTQGGKD